MCINHVDFLPAISPRGEDMVKEDLWHEIHSRRKLKESKKSIARGLQLDIKTLRELHDPSQALVDVPRGKRPAAFGEGPAGLCP
jgi:hypothetical protein